MRKCCAICIAAVTVLMLSTVADAQVGVFSHENMIRFTPEWKGERFSDGRPKVPDDILERMKNVTLTHAWSILQGAGYEHQFEGGFICTQEDEVLVGRALTAVYMPRRPDVRKVMEEDGKQDSRAGDQISWPIEALVKGDVYVADMFGKIEKGPIIGDNLGTAIKANSGNGVVFDGSVRDIEGLKDIPHFPCFIRGWHPSIAAPTIMLMGLNAPIRIGHVTVMPGDVVLGRYDGVVFIPPHLAEKVVVEYERVMLKDMFGKQRLSEGKYTSGAIDGAWTKEMQEDYKQWLTDNADKLPVPAGVVRKMIQELLLR